MLRRSTPIAERRPRQKARFAVFASGSGPVRTATCLNFGRVGRYPGESPIRKTQRAAPRACTPGQVEALRPTMKLPPLNLRIGHRLGLCFSLILVLMFAGAWLMVSSARDSRETLVRMVEHSNKRMSDIGAMRELLEDQDRLAQRLGLATGIEVATSDMQAIDADIAAYRRIAARFDFRSGGAEEQAPAEQVKAYDHAVDESVASARRSVVGYNPGMAARTLSGEVAPVRQ